MSKHISNPKNYSALPDAMFKLRKDSGLASIPEILLKEKKNTLP